VRYIERAIELNPSGSGPDRALLLGILAAELTFSGEHERRLRYAQEAEDIAREVGDPALLCRVLTTTAYEWSHGPVWEQSVTRCEEAMRLADEIGDPSLRAVSRLFMSSALVTAGRVAESLTVTGEMLAIAATDVGPLIRWGADANAIRVPILKGRLDEADELNNELLARGQQFGQEDAAAWFVATAGGTAWLRGNAGAMADAVGMFAEQYPRNKVWRCAQAWMLADAGRLDESRAVIAGHALDPVEVLIEPWPLLGSSELALAMFRLDDRALAARMLEALEPYRECWSHYFLVVLGPITWPTGLARAVLGEFDAAVRDLEDAIRKVLDVDAPGMAAHMRIDLAQVLRRRNADGDARRAVEELRAARELAEAFGAADVVTRIDHLLAS
jgi:hypothetical protein